MYIWKLIKVKFKVEKSKNVLGAVLRAVAPEWPNAMRAKNITNYITIKLLNYAVTRKLATRRLAI